MKKVITLLLLFISLKLYSQTEGEYGAKYIECFQKKDFKGAIFWIDKAIEVNPNSETVFLMKADALFCDKQYLAAWSCCKTSISLGGDGWHVYYLKGMCESNLRQYADAIIDFSTAITENPKKGEAYGQRGLAQYELGNIKQACYDFQYGYQLGEYTCYEMMSQYCK